MNAMASILLEAPGTQLDASVKKLILSWDDPPKAVQVLEVLDRCIYGSLSSGVVVKTLQILYDQCCKAENVTHEEVVKLATWRD